MDKFIAVVDYGLGNLRSVSKALEGVGAKVSITNQTQDLARASAIVLPGVGAFQRAMENLTQLNIIPAILTAIKQGKPFLGICLGLQVLFSQSEEHGQCKGLGIIPGKVKKFAPGVKIPHMGWNNIKLKIKNEKLKMNLFENIPDNSYFYFVHSYYVEPKDKSVIAATTEYARDFVSAVNKDNIWGVQFHPEKSEKLGLKILENFCHGLG
ncbi:MAG: imidazole glycerol phosphate synthase subunit HisH [Candidatus Omnitrophica bacterium]|nr:imidazole glycerol phosphate synthase subunit HisH [Candidatus Omnitrophota bacterium]